MVWIINILFQVNINKLIVQITACIFMVVPIEIKQSTKVRGNCMLFQSRLLKMKKILLDNLGLPAGCFPFL